MEARAHRVLTPVDRALKVLEEEVIAKLGGTGFEEVHVLESLGRICAEDVYAPFDIPPYDRSAVDGYAVAAEDTFGASPTNPVELRIVGRISAGYSGPPPSIGRGEAVEVSTGAPLPDNANAVVAVEDTREVGGALEVYRPVHPLQNVSRKGEDFRAGEVVIEKGTRIKPWHIGAIASLNISRIKVSARPRVGILSTGDELVDLGTEPERGKIVNSTKPMLMGLTEYCGGQPVDLGTVPDDLETIRRTISEKVELCDLLIVTGGTSVGRADLVPRAVEEAGRVILHGIAMRPGRPTGFGKVKGKPVFMLSGFPVASLVGFNLLVKPVIEAMLGARPEPSPRVRGRLSRRLPSSPGNRCFVRVRVRELSDGYLVEPLMLTGSGLISTLTRANGILVIPEWMEGYEEGEEVEVELIGPPISADTQ